MPQESRRPAEVCSFAFALLDTPACYNSTQPVLVLRGKRSRRLHYPLETHDRLSSPNCQCDYLVAAHSRVRRGHFMSRLHYCCVGQKCHKNPWVLLAQRVRKKWRDFDELIKSLPSGILTTPLSPSTCAPLTQRLFMLSATGLKRLAFHLISWHCKFMIFARRSQANLLLLRQPES